MRLEKLQQMIEQEAYLVQDPINLYYLTGFELSAGTLLVTPKDARLLVDGRYFELCKKGNIPTTLVKDNGLKEALQGFKSVGFNAEKTSCRTYTEWQKDLSDITFVPVSDLVRAMREEKEPLEIEALRKAANLGREGYNYVLTLLREGISEEEVASELEIFWKQHGGKKVAFDPIIAFGANSSMPHYRASSTTLKKGDVVLIDIGVTLNHYHSDMTRVVSFGEPNHKLIEIHAIVAVAQKRALALCRPHTRIGDLDQAARSYIASKGYGEAFSHSLGHGVGLEVHELPVLRNAAPFADLLLKPGMVITIEPGIYLPGIGGIRIEDTIVITENGYENLTNTPGAFP